MSPARRAGLDRDAGGDDAEECAVCYLQILLADELTALAARACCVTWMPGDIPFAWAAPGWFEQDAADACVWLQSSGVVTEDLRPPTR